MQKTGLLILSFFLFLIASGQRLTIQQYIDTYKDLAIKEMKRTGIPASITIAQGILETENGNGDLVLKSNNHFGIKCKSNWGGESVYHNDDEQGECFRKYNNAEESFRDHSDFLRNSSRYSSLFLLGMEDYKAWAFGLKKAGYATNPHYPNILINSIQKYNLNQYTLQGLQGDDVFDNGKYKDEKEKEQTIAILPVKTKGSSSMPITVQAEYSISPANGIKSVFAKEGTSLLAIATENDIALSRLLDFNDLTTDGLLQKAQRIFLEKKLKEGNTDNYITKRGETLYDVSQATGIQLAYLEQYNHLKSMMPLAEGTGVALRPGVAIVPPAELSSSKKLHEVLPKEGLYVISKKYNVSVKELKEWNNLSSDDLHVGQQLIILK